MLVGVYSVCGRCVGGGNAAGGSVGGGGVDHLCYIIAHESRNVVQPITLTIFETGLWSK